MLYLNQKHPSVIKKKHLLSYKLVRYSMKQETVTIPKEEYKKLKKKEQIDTELLKDIAMGIKDVLSGKIKEV